jgi:hypothetical protein
MTDHEKITMDVPLSRTSTKSTVSFPGAKKGVFFCLPRKVSAQLIQKPPRARWNDRDGRCASDYVITD